MAQGTLVVAKALLDSLTPDGVELIMEWIKDAGVCTKVENNIANVVYKLDHPDFLEALQDDNGYYSLYMNKQYDGYNFNYVIQSLHFHSAIDKKVHIVRRYT
jgi:hypothetical protein